MSSSNHLNNERQKRILDLLRTQTSVRVSELSQLFGVSETTVRRDLDSLTRMDYVERIHGGAMLVERASPEPALFQREIENIEQKRRIGKATAEMIEDGETVFIGSGTTTLQVSRNLVGRENLTVITNSLTVMNTLVQQSGITLISLGGVLRQSELSFIGHLAAHTLQELRPQKVIMGIRAISLEAGLTNEYLPEVTADRVIIKSAPEVILVADYSKFRKITAGFVAPITSVSTIVTDTDAPADVLEEIRKMGITVLQV